MENKRRERLRKTKKSMSTTVGNATISHLSNRFNMSAHQNYAMYDLDDARCEKK